MELLKSNDIVCELRSRTDDELFVSVLRLKEVLNDLLNQLKIKGDTAKKCVIAKFSTDQYSQQAADMAWVIADLEARFGVLFKED